jgi:hypothetical protein
MSTRTIWSLAALAGVVLLVVGLGTLWAQIPAPGGFQPFMPGPMMGGAPHGRFTVAHASEKRIVILDTATGKLYQAKDADLLPISDLPKVGQPPRPPRDDAPGRPEIRQLDKGKKIEEKEKE